MWIGCQVALLAIRPALYADQFGDLRNPYYLRSRSSPRSCRRFTTRCPQSTSEVGDLFVGHASATHNSAGPGYKRMREDMLRLGLLTLGGKLR